MSTAVQECSHFLHLVFLSLLYTHDILLAFFCSAKHCRKPLADSQLPDASLAFVEACWKEIVEKKLSQNLLLHLVSLRDFGLVAPATVHKCYTRFLELSRPTV